MSKSVSPAPPLSLHERATLRLIRKAGGITRIETAQALGVSRMHATNITKVLLRRGLVVEEADRIGTRGQPTRTLRLKADAACAAGVSFSHNAVEIGLVSYDGAMLTREVLPINSPSIEEISKVIHETVKRQLEEQRLPLKRLSGIGISLPGDFQVDQRTITSHYFPQFSSVDMQAALQAHLPAAVFVENDSACACWGESLIGAGKPLDSMMYVFIGHGVGGGFVLQGRLIRGHHGNAGVFGMSFPMDQPRPSGTDLLKSLRTTRLRVEDFHDLAAVEVSHPGVSAWLDRAAGQLLGPLGVLARAVDPEGIVVGGRLPASYLQGLVARLDTEAFCALNRHELPTPRLLASSLGQTSGVIGGAALAFDSSD